MQGYALDMFKEDLTKVPAKDEAQPIETAVVLEALGPKVLSVIREYYSDNEGLRRLPAKLLTKRLTFDQLCRYKYGQHITMDESIEKLFDETPEYAIVRKIQNSMWRWGCGDRSWNEVVDAYNGIRNFSLGVDGFELRLDFTTWFNYRGYSRESRTFLDGVFGFLVYYKGEHVMTLGFSFARDRRLLVQQVQLAKRKGNRFLFKLPENRMEFFLTRFAAAFPNHVLCVADGGDIAKTNLNSYKEALEQFEAMEARGRADDEDRQHGAKLKLKVEHLSADLPRLRKFYANTGCFKRGEAYKCNGVRHYALAA